MSNTESVEVQERTCLHCGIPLAVCGVAVCTNVECLLNGLEQDPDHMMMVNDYRQGKIIEMAVHAADSVIMDNSNGSVEETDWLTSAVALKFMEKAHQANSGRLLRKEILGDPAPVL